MQNLIPLLTIILSNHKEWFKTKGSSGIFADLSKENLEKGNFSNSILVEANFEGSNINKSNFQNSDLIDTNITKDQIKFVFNDEGTLFPSFNLS